MKKLISLSLILASTLIVKAQDPLPKVVSGKIERVENFQSKYVTERNVDIWLPENYSESKKFAVLYMHDGQMLFDPKNAWNKQAWNVDDVATDLLEADQIKDFIVVGIWNGGATRHPDYFPKQPFESLSKAEKDTVNAQLHRASRGTAAVFNPQSDNYLKFIVKELKPYIDKNYAVSKNRKNTYIAGSSMGGLISMYAICQYPKVFGGAACLSTHWIGTFTPEHNPIPDAFLSYLSNNLPNPKKHKLYFDCGDQTLDQYYPNIHKRVDEVMTEKGYGKDNWLTKYFPGENHSEDAWNKRLDIPMVFLLGK